MFTGRRSCLAAALCVGILLGCGEKVGARGPDAAEDAEGSRPLDTAKLSVKDMERVKRAAQLMDAGELDAALEIVLALREEHPNHVIVLHELSLVHRLMRQPEKAVALLRPHENNLPPELAGALGSALDEAGDVRGATRTLTRALERHPDSGLLYSELGTVAARAGRPGDAVEKYLQGMEAEPSWPSNYFGAAQVLANSDARGLSLVFGETFRLLEPSTERSAKLAVMMVRVCQDAVKIQEKEPELKASVSLAPTIVVESPEEVENLPFVNAFELTFGGPLTMAVKDGLSLATLDRARGEFLDSWWKPKGASDHYDVPLFAWQRDLREAGHFEAYSYWLFGPAFADEFRGWLSANESKLEAMASYIDAHPLFAPPG